MNYYEIKFNGIKDGSHSNSFEIKDKFFDTFENSEIKQAEITASTTLNKQENKTTLNISLVGTVNNIPCDICTDKIDIPISSKTKYIVKERKNNNSYNEDVIFVDALENTINLKNRNHIVNLHIHNELMLKHEIISLLSPPLLWSPEIRFK